MLVAVSLLGIGRRSLTMPNMSQPVSMLVLGEKGRPVTTYSRDDLRAELDDRLDELSLTFDDFLELGKAGELSEIDETLAFVYHALLPALDPTAA